MTTPDQNPIPADEEQGSQPSPIAGNTFKDKLYSKIPKELTEEDLTNPGVVRLILAQNEDLLSDNIDLKGIRDKYYKEQRELGKVEEQANRNRLFDCFFDFIMALGGIFGGLCTNDFSQEFKVGNSLMLILAAICIVGGQLIKRLAK